MEVVDSENPDLSYRTAPIKRKEVRLPKAGDDKKSEKKEARNSGLSDGAGSSGNLGGEHSPKSIWVRHTDPRKARHQSAYDDLINGYIKHIRKA